MRYFKLGWKSSLTWRNFFSCWHRLNYHVMYTHRRSTCDIKAVFSVYKPERWKLQDCSASSTSPVFVSCFLGRWANDLKDQTWNMKCLYVLTQLRRKLSKNEEQKNRYRVYMDPSSEDIRFACLTLAANVKDPFECFSTVVACIPIDGRSEASAYATPTPPPLYYPYRWHPLLLT